MREITRVGHKVDLAYPTVRQAELIHEANEIARQGGGHPDLPRQVACLHLAIQEQGDPVSLHDLADASGIDPSRIHSVSQDIYDRLDIKIDPRHPGDFVDRFIAELNSSDSACLTQETRDVAMSLVDCDIDRAPVSVAAGAVYIGAHSENKRVTFDQLARVANLDPRTVSAAADELSEKL